MKNFIAFLPLHWIRLWFAAARAILLALIAGLLFGAWIASPLAACAAESRPKPCVIFIDDVSSPSQLNQHGIAPFDPEHLAYAFDALGAKNTPCMLLYLVVRQDASRAIPVIMDVPVNQEDPPAPPEKGMKLPDLQKAWVAYRQAKAAYDERNQEFEGRREEARQQFIMKGLDALANAEAEASALRRSHSGYRAGDIEGTILSAISTAKTLRSSSILLVLNTDLVDSPSHRRARKSAFTEEELPPDLVHGLVLVNTSFRPDSSPLISKTTIPKHHAPSLKAVSDLVANLLPNIK